MGLFSRAEEFEFKVSGMDCGGCENKIIRTLTGIRGVKKVEASASQGSVSVTSKGVDSGTLSVAIESVGFKVE
jgi:Cd2+/Zn2+-exporting ATPase